MALTERNGTVLFLAALGSLPALLIASRLIAA